MGLCFLGTSHAAVHLRNAARERGLPIVSAQDADVIFVSEDTPTDSDGRRDMRPIIKLIEQSRKYPAVTVVTSAVEPGFTRALGYHDIWHQAETLRIKDAAERARHPEMLIVGSYRGDEEIPPEYMFYLNAWKCPVLQMTWESAEFAKVAINCTLASQVENTNRLQKAAEKFGADWLHVANALMHDKRIGKYAYLTPGRWQDSKHILRDMRTLESC